MMVSTREEWSKEVRKAMIDKDISQKELAHKFYYTYTSINAVVNGKQRSKRLEKLLSDYFGIYLESGWRDEQKAEV